MKSVARAVVSTSDDLVYATQDAGVREIVVAHSVDDVPSLMLSPAQTLRGHDANVTITFRDGSDGLQVSSDNVVSDLSLRASPQVRAIFNNTNVPTLGRVVLRDLTVVGRVQILARDRLREGHLEVHHLDIVSADAHAESERPDGYGVSVRQGAFTVWNMQSDDTSLLTADLRGLSAGRLGRPVFGSGIFLSGAGDGGGWLEVQRLETEGVYSDGQIPQGTADQIAVGVGTLTGARVDVVRNHGPVVTYGVNDMALDNWGVVDRWVAAEKVTTYGSSAIGFVNFGLLSELHLDAPIETFGAGSRGFNVYEGKVSAACFDRIVTHGDGAVGVQISQPIREFIVRRGIETFGGTGPSLVKGVLQNLSAIALSIKPGGSIEAMKIEGGLRTNARGVSPLEQQGSVRTMSIAGGCSSATKAE